MTSTKKKTPAERQLDEGPGTHLGGGSEGKRTTAPLAGLPAALPWAARFIRAGGPDVPDYGSPAWERLDDRDARKVAACVLAAEVHRAYWSPAEHARRLHAELEAARDAERDDDAITTGARLATERADFLAAHAKQVGTRCAQQLQGMRDRKTGALLAPTAKQLAIERGEPHKVESARAHQRRIDVHYAEFALIEHELTA
jgi:hypothetical protein